MKNNKIRPKYTPEMITELADDEVFVFGSNASGNHKGGASLVAHQKFGAKMGVSNGPTGKAYAITTTVRDIETLERSIDEFFNYVCENREKTFYVTKIGCGAAGFKVEEVAELFYRGRLVKNVIYPREFVEIFDTMTPNFEDNIKYKELISYSGFRMVMDLAMIELTNNPGINKEQLKENLVGITNEMVRRNTFGYMYYHIEENFGDENDRYDIKTRKTIDKITKGIITAEDISDKLEIDILVCKRSIAKLLTVYYRCKNNPLPFWPHDIWYEIMAAMTGRFNCGSTSYLNDCDLENTIDRLMIELGDDLSINKLRAIQMRTYVDDDPWQDPNNSEEILRIPTLD